MIAGLAQLLRRAAAQAPASGVVFPGERVGYPERTGGWTLSSPPCAPPVLGPATTSGCYWLPRCSS